MQQSNYEANTYENEEINLSSLINTIFARKFLIIGITGFVTILALIYSLSIKPLYKTSISFSSAPKSSITNLNKLIYTATTKESIFSDFLTILSSRNLQKKVFSENNFLTLFNKDNLPIDDVDKFITNTIASVEISLPKLNAEDLELYLYEKPYTISMVGSNYKDISDYLIELVSQANSKNIIEIIKLNQQKISIRLDQIKIEISELLTSAKQIRLNQINRIMEEDDQKIREIISRIEALKIKAKQDRLNQINRIMEEDDQKIREINDQINRVRYEAKENRLNQIVVLADSAKLAKSLGIIENNFKFINDNITNSDLTIAIGESKDLPEWYFYGEKALLERIELLDSRTSDDPFIPELITLNNQLNEIQNNNLLKTLVTRQDDSPFIPELVTLNIEKNKLLLLEISLSDSTSINIIEAGKIKTIAQSKRVIVLLSFFISLMLSILLVLIMSALKPDEKTPA